MAKTTTNTQFTATGIVRAAETQKPLAGMRVQVCDCDLRRQQPLHDNALITDREGRYQVAFTKGRFSRAEKDGPDLQVLVFAPEDEAMEQVLARSGIRFNAPEHSEIDVTVPADAYRVPVEWVQLLAEARRLGQRSGLSVEEWEENETHRDLSFIAGETGRDVKVVRAFALAHRLAKRTKMERELWFALLRYETIGSYLSGSQDMAEQTAQILQAVPKVEADTVRRNLQKAIQNRSIPDMAPDAIETCVSKWQVLAIEQIEQQDHRALQIAELAGLSAAKRKQYLSFFQQHNQRLDDKLFGALRDSGTFTPKEVLALEVSARLADLTDGNFDLIRLLKTNNGKKLLDPALLAQQSWEEWEALLAQLAEQAPASRRLASDGSEPPISGTILAARFKQAYPTQAFTGALNRAQQSAQKRAAATPDSTLPLQYADRIRQFLQENPGFDFMDTGKTIESWLSAAKPAKRRAAAVADSNADAGFADELKAVQRVFRLNPDFDASMTLLSDGLHSGQQIYLLGEQQFTERYAERPGFSEELARDVWRKSAELNHSIVYWLGEVRANQNAQLIKVLRNGDPNPNMPQARGTFPNYETLFGSTDVCTCEHCKSVYSPAAYLADVIMFLKNRKINNPNYPNYDSAWDVLRERRPDLGFLDFSCDNSNVVLPYIDLVNEVLEEAVSTDLVVLPIAPDESEEFRTTVQNTLNLKLDTDFVVSRIWHYIPGIQKGQWIVRDKNFTLGVKRDDTNNYFIGQLRQTRGKSEDLIARPQHVNKEAYSVLRSAQFPHSLPFDLAGEELRHYLQKSGIQRWELMQLRRELFLDISQGDIACEYFGISADKDLYIDEKRLILKLQNDEASQRVIWGEPTLEGLSQVNKFLSKTGLDYQQMLALLDLAFVNPNGAILIEGDNCNTQAQTLTNLNASSLDRIHRFLRLWRKIGLKMWELDMLLMHPKFGNGRLGDQETAQDPVEPDYGGFLTRLMQGLEIQKRLGISIEQLCALFGNIPDKSKFTAAGKAREASLFDQLFLNPRLINPVDGQFRTLLSNGTISLVEQRPTLMAGLRLRAADFDRLLEAANLQNYSVIGYDEVSILYREALLCKALGIDTKDWEKLSNLIVAGSVESPDQYYIPSRLNTVESAFSTPEDALLWIEKIQRSLQMGMSIDELAFVMKTEEPEAEHPASTKKALPWIKTLRQELVKIQTSYFFDPADLPTVSENTANPTSALRQLLASGLSWLAWSDSDISRALEYIGKTQQKQDYSGGFNALQPNEQRFLRTRLQYFQTPQVSVTFEGNLPSFPANAPWKTQISYDKTAKTLTLSGCILSEEFAALKQLSDVSDESGWQTAIEGLQLGLETGQDASNKWLEDSTIIAFAAEEVQTLGMLLSTLGQYRINTESEQLIVKTLSQKIPAKNELEAVALVETLQTQQDYDQLLGSFKRLITLGTLEETGALHHFQALYRMALLADKWGIDAGRMKWIIRKIPHPLANTLNPVRLLQSRPADTDRLLHIDRLINLHRVWKFYQKYFDSEGTFFDILSRIPQQNQSLLPQFPTFVSEVAKLTSWKAEYIQTAIERLQWESAKLVRIDIWEHLEAFFVALDKTNSKPELLQDISKVKPDMADQFITRLAARYDEKEQNGFHRDIQNKLRERKRDALIAYLLTNGSQWQDANDLFSHFLIDVEMSSCHQTSRIVQAHGTVQMFVQRCLMGLEPAVKPQNDPVSWEQWKWMKNYRLWEANRRVFLYPENWLEPELRRDKSPFFKDLENALLQSNLDKDSIETAFLRYVEQLDGVANMEPMGHWYEEEKDILHVFARTSGEPHIYYYRQWRDNAYWTPWEKVDADIKSDYLIPTVRNGQVQLFWPEFMEEPEEVTSVRVPIQSAITVGNDRFQLDQPRKKVKIFMVSSRFVNRKWDAKVISKTALELSNVASSRIYKDKFLFIIGKDFANRMLSDTPPSNKTSTDLFTITCFNVVGTLDGYQTYDVIGFFDNQGCKNSLEARSLAFLDKVRFLKKIFINTDYFNMKSVDNSTTLDRLATVVWGSTESTTILKSNLGLFVATESWQRTGLEIMTESILNGIFNDGPRVIFSGDVGTFFIRTHSLKNYFASLILTSKSGITEHYHSSHLKKQIDQRYKELSNALSNNSISLAQYIQGCLEVLNYIGQNFRFKHYFHSFDHSLTCLFNQNINRGGISGLLNRSTQLTSKSKPLDFAAIYEPNPEAVYAPTNPLTNQLSYPVEDVDFTAEGAYSSYNWELFFHAPMLIAQRLTKDQRFEEAMQWYHYIFNPLGVENAQPDNTLEMPEIPARYWITRPFYEQFMMESGAVEDDEPLPLLSYQGQNIQHWLRQLSLLKLASNDPSIWNEVDKEYKDLLKDQEKAIEIWRKNPFDPHLIARFRTVAYQKGVVMKYIDNLIAWGDHLFRQDTMESVNEATQLYVLAAEILGPRPRKIPQRYEARPLSFHELEPQLDAFSNALIGLENMVPVLPTGTSSGGTQSTPPASTSMLFFCLPPNDKLLEYWDTVADRLYKIRHCQNIEGVERMLALFAPPIDPGAVIGAFAGGGSLSDATAALNAPLPMYRFQVILQKANELCNDLKALGGALLSALEKKDGEEMARLRQGQEMDILKSVRSQKQLQVNEAWKNEESLTSSRLAIQERVNHYLAINKIYPEEALSLEKMVKSQQYQELGQSQQVLAAKLAILPDFEFGISGFGGSPTANVKFGSSNFVQAVKASGEGYSFFSSILNNDSIQAAKSGENKRRSEEWKFQENLATRELAQIDKQIDAARIRLQIAEKELANHNLQISNARAIDEYMRTKYTNQELYEWMSTQISQVYFQTYQMAFDMAKQAERCLQYELGLENTHIIQYGHWDSLKKGLMSAERLQLDLRKLEMAYMDRNKRELEITKHISLNQLNPLALLQLREAGRCDFAIPEELFDLDFPGHYMRRIKSVSITIPCVAGPYTSINATLRLKKSSTRVKASTGNGYPRVEGDDDRFRDQFTGIQSIATSSAQNDSGLFELNFRDERYLPFEGTGVISEWTLEMMEDSKLRQFDYNTISDVIVHLRYTAREGVEKSKVTGALTEQLNALKISTAQTGLARLFSLRHDFPNEWHAWTKQNQALSIKLQKHHFPYFAQMGSLDIGTIQAYEKGKTDEPVALTKTEDANTGWTVTGNLDKTKDDYFLIIHYKI